jgi:DNA-binding Lrp family transcriptional regulator
LDIVGRKLLHALNVDASLPLHMLAKQCGCTLDVVHYRMKTLFKQGVILQYIPFVSLQALGYEEYYCNVSLRHLTFEKAATLKQFLISSGHVKFAFRGASRLEVLFLLAVRTTLELDTFLKEFKSLFSEHILSLDAMLVTEQGPLGWFPKGLVDDHSQK